MLSIAYRRIVLCGGVAALLAPGAARAEDPRIDELYQLVHEQKQEIQELRQEVQELRSEATRKVDEEVVYRDEDGDAPLTGYDNPRIRLDIAGQINQAFNAAGDGDNVKGYFVDNDTSNTRLRFAGVGTFAEGPEVGTTLEIALSPNPSSDVSQNNEIAGDFFQVRRAELFVIDRRYGRLMFGRGSAAADDTAEYSLSLVSGPIMYSGVSDIVGGLQFTDGDGLTGVQVNDVFSNFDGNRQNRIRYDTPMFGPVQFGVSVGADQRYDFALTFGGDYGHWTGIELGEDFVTLGAVSIYDPNQSGVDYRTAGSWSLLHNPSGVSVSVSAGADIGAEGDTPYNLYGQLAWDTELLPLGATGFGVDYTWSENITGFTNEGQSVGLAAVQLLENYGIELYSQFRWYSVDREFGPSLADIFVGTLGSRVRF
jgi:hypothetical protein